MSIVTAKIHSDMSDSEIRAAVRQAPNGEYAVWVCRNCGIYTINPEHNKDVYIRCGCDGCFDPDEDDEEEIIQAYAESYFMDDEDRWLSDNETYWNNLHKSF
jgi:hypothetical protein